MLHFLHRLDCLASRNLNYSRAIDIGIALPFLVFLLPFCAVLSAIIMRDGGPILYWQRRAGVDGRPFPFPKFRSMVVNAEARRHEVEHLNEHGAGAVTFKAKSDPRITPIGRIIRRLSVDEIPQLYSVIMGNMALVGPRPPTLDEERKYTEEQRRRLSVKGGLTCYWQVRGRGRIPFEQQVQMDLEYIRDKSVPIDLMILMLTIPAVLSRKGAH